MSLAVDRAQNRKLLRLEELGGYSVINILMISHGKALLKTNTER